MKEGHTCIYLKENGKWANGPCRRKKAFACEDKTKSGVWKITVEKGTWEEGKQICQERFGGFSFQYLNLEGLRKIIEGL